MIASATRRAPVGRESDRLADGTFDRRLRINVRPVENDGSAQQRRTARLRADWL
jgi:hypothetical protein